VEKVMPEIYQPDLFADILEEKKKPVEKPKEEPKPEKKKPAWVPQMVNGEWEIY
jgi:hypothetical protein